MELQPLEPSRSVALLAIVTATLFAIVQAHAQEATATDYERADARLNADYKEALAALPASAREQLRVAERAWIAFTEKNAPALHTLGKKRGLTASELRYFYLMEVEARIRQIKALFEELERPSRQVLEAADVDLNHVYGASLAVLESSDKERLREAQRAWVAFRDEHLRASGNQQAIAALLLTERRAAELSEFYLRAPRLTIVPKRAPREATGESLKPQPANVPDPFERAR